MARNTTQEKTFLSVSVTKEDKNTLEILRKKYGYRSLSSLVTHLIRKEQSLLIAREGRKEKNAI